MTGPDSKPSDYLLYNELRWGARLGQLEWVRPRDVEEVMGRRDMNAAVQMRKLVQQGLLEAAPDPEHSNRTIFRVRSRHEQGTRRQDSSQEGPQQVQEPQSVYA